MARRKCGTDISRRKTLISSDELRELLHPGLPTAIRSARCTAAFLLLLLAPTPHVLAQVQFQVSPAQTQALETRIPAVVKAADEPKPAETKPADAAADAAKSDEAKPDESKAKEASKESAKPVLRPERPATPPDPAELKVRPDEDGKVRFNFHGQSWQGVLDWLAAISEMSLDWQELPGDFLNLRTQRSYTVAEARDLINRHLLDRGFTMLRHGEVLTIVNTKKLDPSLVPRVKPEELAERDPHEFVKVSFPLDWLMAETTIEELKPLASPNGKLTPLKATNRLEAIDAVVNLRDIQTLLTEEQSQKGRKRLVRPFRLKHVRADEVKRQLEGLLGLTEDPMSAVTRAMSESSGPEQMGQMQILMQMQAQATAAAQAAAQAQGPKPPPKIIHMVVNARENTLLVHASADQLAIVAEAIEVLDQPSENASLLQTMSRVRVYRLVNIDPEPVVTMLKDLGGLEPTTRLQVDKKNHSLIVHGALADHLIVRQLLEKLDGSDRQFEVVRLRRLEADYVAGTIEFMMAGSEKKQTTPYNPFMFFDGGGLGGQETQSKKFRVDADIENNRLLLWANAIEMEEVQRLLVKLGELTAEGGSAARQRVIETISPEEAAEFLKRLKKNWRGIAPNPLEIQVPETSDDAPDEELESEPRTPSRRESAPARPKDRISTPSVVPGPAREPEARRGTRSPRRKELALATPRSRWRAVSQVDETEVLEEEEPADREPVASPRERRTRSADHSRDDSPDSTEERDSAKALDDDVGSRRDRSRETGERRDSRSRESRLPPVKIWQGLDGRLVISSDDTEALDQLEDVVSRLAPVRRDYKIFKMKHSSTWAWSVAQNLRDFFNEKEKDKGRRDEFFGPWWANMNSGKAEERRRLSKRRPLKFISDSDSNSIIVTGADPQQLQIIEELIALYDVPDSKDQKAMRITRMFTVHYSKARVIAEAIKEVYRDLLSESDPALANKGGDGDKNKRPAPSMYTYVLGGGGDGEDGEKPKNPVKLKGMLSIGVDDISNTLVVSATEGLMNELAGMIEALDQAAMPNVSRMQVLKLGRQIDADVLQDRLQKLLKRPAPPPQQQQQPNQPGQPVPQQPQPTPVTVIDNG